MATVRRFDRGMLRQPKTLSSGARRVDGHAARVGVQVYSDGRGGIRRELRLPEEVFSTASLESYDGAWITDGHPSEFVTPQTARDLSRGLVTEPARQDGDLVAMASVIDDARLLRKLDEIQAAGKHAELSVGYYADLDETPGVHPKFGRYDAIQRNIRVNHVAIVPVGRAGREARLRLDEGEMISLDLEGALTYLLARTDDNLNAAARHALPASSFAVPNSEDLPINDPEHIRAAMARFGQEHFPDLAAKRTAYHRILAGAKSHGIDSTGFQKEWSGRLDHDDKPRTRSTTMDPKELEALKKALATEKQRADTLAGQLAAEKARADQAEGSVNALTAERDKLRAGRIDEAEVNGLKQAVTELQGKLAEEQKRRIDETDPKIINKRVRDRFEVVRAALEVDPAMRVDEMTDREIRCATITKISGDQIPTTRSDDYVAGVFEKLIESRRAWSSQLPKPGTTVVIHHNRADDNAAANDKPKKKSFADWGSEPLPNSREARASRE